MSFYNKNLRDGEEIILILRRNWITYLPKIILVFILFFVPIFFMFPLLAWGQVGQIIFAILLAVALFYLLKLLSLSYFNCLLITNDRLIDFSQNKTFERTVKETDFLNIAEVSYKIKGILQMISKCGNLEIKLKSSNQEPSLNIKGISNPEKLQILILDLKRLAIEEQKIHEQQKGISDTYQEILKKIKKDIGQEGIDRLLRSINPEEHLEFIEDIKQTKNKNKEKDFDFFK